MRDKARLVWIHSAARRNRSQCYTGSDGGVGVSNALFLCWPEKVRTPPMNCSPWTINWSNSWQLVKFVYSPSYALKLSPHEQLVAAFGFFPLKPPSSASM